MSHVTNVTRGRIHTRTFGPGGVAAAAAAAAGQIHPIERVFDCSVAPDSPDKGGEKLQRLAGFTRARTPEIAV